MKWEILEHIDIYVYRISHLQEFSPLTSNFLTIDVTV